MKASTVQTLFSKKQTAEILGCAEITVHRLLKAKRLGYFRFGSMVKIGQGHIDDFLRRAERKPKEAA